MRKLLPPLYTIRTFISYEDPESLKKKCEYVVDHKLAGIMFWEYSGDSANALLDSIDTGLQHHPATATESK
ncbi:GH18 family chitinase [Edaphobacter lichenicola]|uniref:GH18 family chitinase n=1 Tax=Tunturiibacter lichenicola TaxID=2051959 RepID=A0A852VLQ5_9BACT|nr:GH18 family chitinase [Edaphobacter lichenicola]